MPESDYLERTNSSYWDLEEAVASFMNDGNCSFDQAVPTIRSNLDKYNYGVAKTWKKNWKEYTKAVKDKFVPLRQEAESSSTVSYNQNFNANTYNNQARSTDHNQCMNNLFDDDINLEEVAERNKRRHKGAEKDGSKKSKTHGRSLHLPRLPTQSNISAEDYVRNPPTNAIKLPSNSTHDELFILYQVESAKKLKQMILIENDTHKVFAIDNILLIKNYQHSKLLLDVFGEQNLDFIKQMVFEKFGVKSVVKSPHKINVINIIDEPSIIKHNISKITLDLVKQDLQSIKVINCNNQSQ